MSVDARWAAGIACVEVKHERPGMKRTFLRLELDEAKQLRDALAAVITERLPDPVGPPEGYIVPEGDERCDFTMDACVCMKRKGHDGLHACAHGGWR